MQNPQHKCQLGIFAPRLSAKIVLSHLVKWPVFILLGEWRRSMAIFPIIKYCWLALKSCMNGFLFAFFKYSFLVFVCVWSGRINWPPAFTYIFLFFFLYLKCIWIATKPFVRTWKLEPQPPAPTETLSLYVFFQIQIHSLHSWHPPNRIFQMSENRSIKIYMHVYIFSKE